jgi:predicted nucleotidyltransferase
MEAYPARQSSTAPHPCVIELRETLQSVLGENFVRLYHYGSRVEGGATDDSDYDVLCVTKRALSREKKDEILDRQLDIQMRHNALLDLHFYSENEINTPPISYTPYIKHVIAGGLIV